MNNRLEPIQNNPTTTSATCTSTSVSTSNGPTGSAEDGLSSFMSEVYNVLDGQEDSSGINLPTNGDTINTDFLEMREIQGLYDDDMTYTHFASAFEIPQSKSITSSSQSTPYSTSSLMLSSTQDFNSSSKISGIDSLSHNLDSILNKPPNSCVLGDKGSDSTFANMYMTNNSLPNHNMANSAFTSTNQKPSIHNHTSTNSSTVMLTSGGSSNLAPGYCSPTNKSVPVSYSSPTNEVSVPTGYNSPNSKPIASGYTSPKPMMSYTPTASPGVPAITSPGVPSPHKSMSPLVNNASPSSTPGSPHHNSDSGKKKTGLNVIPTEKLMDTSIKQNQLINTNASVSSYYPMMPSSPNMLPNSPNMISNSSNMISNSIHYGSSYYNSMYPYMNHSSSQVIILVSNSTFFVKSKANP